MDNASPRAKGILDLETSNQQVILIYSVHNIILIIYEILGDYQKWKLTKLVKY